MSYRTAADLSRHFGDPHRRAFLLGSVDYSIIKQSFQGVQGSSRVHCVFLGVFGELLNGRGCINVPVYAPLVMNSLIFATHVM